MYKVCSTHPLLLLYLFSDYTCSLDDIGYDRECKLSELQRYEMQLVQCNEQIHNVSLMCGFIIIIIYFSYA
jgi:hypothetical protein